MILSKSGQCSILVLVDGWVLYGREDGVRVPLRCPQVLQNRGHISRPASPQARGYVLLPAIRATHGGIRWFDALERRRHNHIEIKLLRLNIFNTASVD